MGHISSAGQVPLQPTYRAVSEELLGCGSSGTGSVPFKGVKQQHARNGVLGGQGHWFAEQGFVPSAGQVPLLPMCWTGGGAVQRLSSGSPSDAAMRGPSVRASVARVVTGIRCRLSSSCALTGLPLLAGRDNTGYIPNSSKFRQCAWGSHP